MATRTMGRRSNAVFLDEPRSDPLLRFRWLIAHHGHLRPGTEMLFGMTVAIEAPTHLKRCCGVHRRHAIDASVARFAAHALAHMNRMIEVHEVRQVVHAAPYDGFAFEPASANEFELGAPASDLRVTAHACGRFRHPGKTRAGCVVVAIQTIDSVVLDVMTVIELNRLVERSPDVGMKRTPHPGHQAKWDAEQAADEEARKQRS